MISGHGTLAPPARAGVPCPYRLRLGRMLKDGARSNSSPAGSPTVAPMTFPTGVVRTTSGTIQATAARRRGCGEGMINGPPNGDPFCVLAVTQGLWGKRIAANVRDHAPPAWIVESWAAPARLPLVIDDPDDFLPSSLPPADLLLALGEVPGLGQLLPEVVRRSGARAVIVAIDHTSAMPAGLERQLRGWLESMGVPAVFPKPLCSLTEVSAGVARRLSTSDDPLIGRFAANFGRPTFHLIVEGGHVAQAEVTRDSACGCARHVAEGLPGTPVDQAVEKAGMLHHH